MEPKQALTILETALNSATLKGVYSLQDASNIINALTVLHNLNTQWENSRVPEYKNADLTQEV